MKPEMKQEIENRNFTEVQKVKNRKWKIRRKTGKVRGKNPEISHENRKFKTPKYLY